MMENNKDEVILWEAPKVVLPEFRLYYDSEGKVVCYTCEKLEGNYIVIDSHTFAQARPDVRVVDNKIIQAYSRAIISKLMPDDSQGQDCAAEDISVILDKKFSGRKKKWKLTIYETPHE